MLRVFLGNMDGVLHNVETYFKNQYDPLWLNDEMTKQMIRDVDKSEVLSTECIQSPVFGAIPPTKLSGGVKALMLMKNIPDRVVNASNCGDNCAKWLLALGKEQDITVNLNHIMNFGDGEFLFEILNDHTMVHNMREFVLKAIVFLK